jgi:hypothetical protein
VVEPHLRGAANLFRREYFAESESEEREGGDECHNDHDTVHHLYLVVVTDYVLKHLLYLVI